MDADAPEIGSGVSESDKAEVALVMFRLELESWLTVTWVIKNDFSTLIDYDSYYLPFNLSPFGLSAKQLQQGPLLCHAWQVTS